MQGERRADLLYRLNVIPLAVPRLRERSSDIKTLAFCFLERSARKTGRGIRASHNAVLERMERYPWPGQGGCKG